MDARHLLAADLLPASAQMFEISSDLATVWNEYVSYKQHGAVGDFISSNSELHLVSGAVAIDAIAKFDAADLASDLVDAGISINGSYGRMVSALLPISRIDVLEHIDSLAFARPVYVSTGIGGATTQGDNSMQSDVERTFVPGLTGAGVTIGLLSDSFANLPGANVGIASGDLPGPGNPNGFLTPVNVLQDFPLGTGNETQQIFTTGGPTGGTFTLTFNNGGTFATTGAIPFNATAAQVSTALVGLANIGAGNVNVSGGPLPATINVTFQGTLANINFQQMQSNSAGLTGGASPTANVFTAANGASGTDEGRAMLQIVHDVAPGANLMFATASLSQASFAANITALQAAGADVIVDDVFYFEEPFFQDGVISQAVDAAVANGTSYFALANNHARNSYESAFTSGGFFAAAAFAATTGPAFQGGFAQDFDNSAAVDTQQQFSLTNGQQIRISLQWDQPFFSVSGGAGSANDVDVYVLNAANQIVAGSIRANTGGDPSEFFSFTNNTGATANFNLMIVSRTATLPSFVKYINITNGANGMGALEFATNSGTAYGHANSATGNSVGAAPWFNTPDFGVSPPTLEGFSSAGGIAIRFDTNGNRIGPILRQTPNIVAPDNGNSTFFAGDIGNDADTLPNFSGTSAAAPHAAALAALMLQVNPSATPAQIKAALQSTTTDMDDPLTAGFDVGFDRASGYGLIDALGAIAEITPGVTLDDLNNVLTIDGDINGVNQNDTVRLVRNATDPTLLEVYINNVTTVPNFVYPIAQLNRLNFNGLGGNDALTIDSTNGLLILTNGINFDGGLGFDRLNLSQTAGTSRTSDRVNVGANPGDGQSVIDGQTINFQNIEPVSDNVPAATFSISSVAGIATLLDASNAINYEAGEINAAATWGRVTVDNFEPIEFQNKTNLVIDAGAGADDINLNNPNRPTGLTGTITVNGGDPNSGDTLTTNAVAGTLDFLSSVYTAVGAGQVFGSAATQPLVAFTGVSELVMVVQEADGDGIEIRGSSANDILEFTPGATPDTGLFTGTLDLTNTLATGPFAVTPTRFVGVDSTAIANVDVNLAAGTDTFVFNGTEYNDTIASLSTGGPIVGSIGIRNTVAGQVFTFVDINNPENIVIRGLNGDDTFSHAAAIAIPVSYEGGNPSSGSDVLNFTATATVANLVTVNLGASTIGEATFATATFNGIETLNVSNAAHNLTVLGTAGNDVVSVDPTGAAAATIRLVSSSPAVSAPVVNASGIGTTFTVDTAAGSDTLNVYGTNAAETITEISNVATGTIAITGLVTTSFPTANTESIGVYGRGGVDLISVTASSAAGAAPVFIDGGDPIGTTGDRLTLNPTGVFVVQPGPEVDEGGMINGAGRVNWDHIEELVVAGGGPALILGTEGDDDITVIARDSSTHAGTDGVQDFTVTVNDSFSMLFTNQATVFIDALAGDDDIVIRAPAPNNADWNVQVTVVGGTPASSTGDQGDVLEFETPGSADQVIFTPTGPETGTLTLDQGADSVITMSAGFTLNLAPGVDYISSRGGIEQIVYDGVSPAGFDNLTINGTILNDTLNYQSAELFGDGEFRAFASPKLDFADVGRLTFNGNGGFDVANFGGSAGIDTVTSTATAVTITSTGGTAILTLGTGVDQLNISTGDGADSVDLDLQIANLAKTIDVGRGNDNVNLSGLLVDPADPTIFGGDGDDTLVGSPNPDIIFGGPGNDIIVGGAGVDYEYGEDGNDIFGNLTLTPNGVADDPGNDFNFGGEGFDNFVWEPLDGADINNGGGDAADVFRFFGSAAPNVFTLRPGGTATHFNALIGAVNIDNHGIEDVIVDGQGGGDSFTVEDLYTTEVVSINLVLNAAAGLDTVTINGRNVVDGISLATPTATRVAVSGLEYNVNVDGAVAGEGDILIVNGNDGNDSILSPASLLAFFTNLNLRLNGGVGSDSLQGNGASLTGGDGDDFFAGGTNDDIMDGGQGDDTFIGGGGTDNIGGGAGSSVGDTILVDGTSGVDAINLSLSATGQLIATVNGATTTYNNFVGGPIAGSGVEQILVQAKNGNDGLTINSTNGAIPILVTYDGGANNDLLTLTGGTATSDTYSVGPALDRGTSVIVIGGVTQQVSFLNIEPVIDLVAGPLVVLGTNSNNAITYTQGPNVGAPVANTGLVAIDGFETIEFGNKTALTINALAGNDTVTLANTGAAAPTGLTQIIVSGGTGEDLIDASTSTVATPLRLYGGVGDDTLVGGLAGDLLYGEQGNDTLVDSPGADAYDGGNNGTVPAGFAFPALPAGVTVPAATSDPITATGGFDTIVIRGTGANDVLAATQGTATAVASAGYPLGIINSAGGAVPAATADVITTVGAADVPNAVASRPSVEEVRIEAGFGNDEIIVAHADSYVTATGTGAAPVLAAGSVPQQMVRFDVRGDAPNASDRLTVQDLGVGDLVLLRQSLDQRTGRVTVAPAVNTTTAAGFLGDIVYTGIEKVNITPINPLNGGTGTDGLGRVVVFDTDPFEYNDNILSAEDIAHIELVTRNPNIDPGHNAVLPVVTPAGNGDEDWYAFTATQNGTFQINTLFSAIPNATPANPASRPGLPGNGQLVSALYNAVGAATVPVVVGAPLLDLTGNTIGSQLQFAGVKGVTYYVRIVGLNPTATGLPVTGSVSVSLAVNTYDLTLTQIDNLGPQVFDPDGRLFPAQAVQIVDNPNYNLFDNKQVFNGAVAAAPAPTLAGGVLSFTPTVNLVGMRVGETLTFTSGPNAGRSEKITGIVGNVLQFGSAANPTTFVLPAAGAGFFVGAPTPTPNVNGLTINFRDPVSPIQTGIGPGTTLGALDPLTALNPGNYQVRGDANGIIPIKNVRFGVNSTGFIAGAVLAPTAAALNTTISLNAGAGLSVANGPIVGQILTFTAGPNIGLSGRITYYDAVTGRLSFSSPFPFTIAAGNTFTISPTPLVVIPTPATTTSTVVAGPPLTSVSFNGAAALSPVSNTYVGQAVQFTSGALSGQSRVVTGYHGPTRTFNFANAFSGAPAVGDAFSIVPAVPAPTAGAVTVVGTNSLTANPAGLSQVPNAYLGQILQFTSGALLGQAQLINGYNGAGAFTFANPFGAGMAAGDTFNILPVNTATIILDFDGPLPDDRYTLTVSDEIRDFVGNQLDGNSNASQPSGNPTFASGDGVSGGDFVARFNVDSRPELGNYAAGSAWVDINGNSIFDPNNTDFVNRDFGYILGYTSDELFAGNFAVRNAAGTALFADGFDKMAAYGRVGTSTWRWMIDTDNDGVPNINQVDPAGINGFPVSGDFAPALPGDEVGLFTGNTWFLDVDGDFVLNDGAGVRQLGWTFGGVQVIGHGFTGDFDGDGAVDLGSWSEDVFSLSLSSLSAGLVDGVIDTQFTFGFGGNRERPVAADMNRDGIDDIGLYVPDRAVQVEDVAPEWYWLVSGIVTNDTPLPGGLPPSPALLGPTIPQRVVADPVAIPGRNIVAFTSTPFGNDLYMQFGDEFSLPIVGNFDPPVGEAVPPALQNTRNPLDVTNDGRISAFDALAIINQLNLTGPLSSPDSGFIRAPFLDVNGSNRVDAFDALQIINYLNLHPTGTGSEANDAALESIAGEGAPGLDDQLLALLAAENDN